MLNANYTDLGLKTAFFFAGISLPVIIAAWFMLPETSRRSPGKFAFKRYPRLTDSLTNIFHPPKNPVAELDELFERGIKPWRFAKTKTQVQLDLETRVNRT